jgi:3'-5' exoribonuclease
MRGCIRFTVHDGFVPAADSSAPVEHPARGALRAVPGAPAAVATMRAGDEVRAVLACTRKDRLIARTGTPYLALELRDPTGAIAARVFKDADLQAGRFERGDLVRVTGRVERFRDAPAIEVSSIARAPDADPAAFLPVAYRDLDELDGFLEHLAGEVRDGGFAALLSGILGDRALRAALRRSPCTRTGHHAYLGGLLEHTVAVATLAVEACALHPRLDQDLLLTAAIVHDLGRTREFVLGAEIGLTDEGRLLGHVELGLRMLDERAAPLDDARRLALAHSVIAHHGDRKPATPEALALARLNALDAGIKGALEHGMSG